MLIESYELLSRLFISAALGTLIGLEKQRIEKKASDIKIFSIVSLFGCIGAASILIDIPFSEFFPLLGFLIVILFIYNQMKETKVQKLEHKTDIIIIYSLPIVYLIGLLTGSGLVWESAGLTFLTLGILAIGRKLERTIEILTEKEVSEIIQIGIILFIIFPLLPKDPILIDGIAIDVFLIFAFFLLVTLLNLFAFLVYRVFKRETSSITGFIGGIINPTYAIYQLNKNKKKSESIHIGGITAAMLGSIARNAVLAIIVMPGLTETILPMFMLIGGIMLALIILERRERGEAKNVYKLEHPVTMINSAYAVGILFVALTLFQLGARYFPDYLPILSFIASTVSSGYTMLSLGSVYLAVSQAEILMSIVFAIFGSFFTATITTYITNKKLGLKVFKQTLLVVIILIFYLFIAHII